MDEQLPSEVSATREQVPMPRTSHIGIIEHLKRVIEFFNTADSIEAQHPQSAFRLRIAAVYSCRAIAELMLEQAFQGELTVDREQMKSLLIKLLPYFNLVERIRIHDFHRYGLTPPIPNVKSAMGFGPITLTARNGSAVLQQTVNGPQITCTGNSTAKERRPLYLVDGTFYDEDTEVQVPLREIIRDYFFAVASAVDTYEKLLKSPLGSSPSSFGQLDYLS